ncbi:MAG: MarR family transcriptional regulator [Reinekea sp.]
MSADNHLNSPGFLITDIHRQMRRVYAHRAEESDLTPAQAKALLIIAKRQGVKQKELADILEIQPMTMVKQLDQLAEQGLIIRVPDPNDRRAHLIHLTEDAGPYIKRVKKIINTLHKDMLQDLDEHESEQFFRLLNQIRDRLLTL